MPVPISQYDAPQSDYALFRSLDAIDGRPFPSVSIARRHCQSLPSRIEWTHQVLLNCAQSLDLQIECLVFFGQQLMSLSS